MGMNEPEPIIPEHDRFGHVLRQTLENGGNPTPAQLDNIFATVQHKITSSRAQTVRRVRPDLEAAAASASTTATDAVSVPTEAAATSVTAQATIPEAWRAENQRLRSWVVRLWVGTVASLIACAAVLVFFSMKRSAQPVAVSVSPREEPLETKAPPAGIKPAPPLTHAEAPPSRGPVAPTPTPSIRPEVAEKAPVDMPPVVATTPPPPTTPEPKVEAPKLPDSIPPVASTSVVPPPTPVAPPVEPAAIAQPENVASADDVIVVVNGEPIIGKAILPATETDFKIKLADTGQVVALRWNTLESSERRRIKKQYGLEESGGRTAWGEKVTGARLHLASGRTMDVLPLPDRDFNGQRAFRTANAPLLMIPAADIKSEDAIPCYECDFYTKHEVYDRWLSDKPPASDDAAAHLELARKAATIGLYLEALDQLKSAEIIDPRTEGPNHDFKMEIIRSHARQQTLDLFERMQRANLTRDYFAAAECLEKLDRNFPNSEFKSRWDAMRAGIEAGCKTEVRKRVIQMSYTVALDLIQKQLARRVKVDAKGNIVPSLPGKQVTTSHGDIFRGTLIPGDGYGIVSLKVGEMNLTIPTREVVSIDDVDLSVGVREVPLTFDDLKDYVSDTRRPDGLKAQLVTTIARTLRGTGIAEKDVRDYFDRRTNKDARYEEGRIISDPVYATIHDAAYGRGGWLRDGVKQLPLSDSAELTTLRPHNSHAQPYANAKPVENPETSDDPNVWFANQSTDTQLSILRAIAAEKLFSSKVTEERCNECAGTGTMTTAGPGGHPITFRCPTCRGLRVLFKLTYE